MADRELITAEDMDAMTPNERAEVVRQGIATSWDEVPADFREKVQATARRLSAERAAARQA